MAYDPTRFVNPSFANAQNAIGGAQVADLQNKQDFASKRDYKLDWWKRGILDGVVGGVKGAAIGGLTGGLPGAIAGGATGAAGGFAQDALDKTKGYQGPGTSSVQASQLGGLIPIGAAAFGKAIGNNVGKDAMSSNNHSWWSGGATGFKNDLGGEFAVDSGTDAVSGLPNFCQMP
jgi:hypothetical protein